MDQVFASKLRDPLRVSIRAYMRKSERIQNLGDLKQAEKCKSVFEARG